MKKFKNLLIVFFFLIAMLVFNTSSFAANTTNGKYLGLYEQGNGRPTGFYTSGRKKISNSASLPIIKIVEYSGQDGKTQKNNDEAIYCLKDGVGFGANA